MLSPVVALCLNIYIYFFFCGGTSGMGFLISLLEWGLGEGEGGGGVYMGGGGIQDVVKISHIRL